jgi:hypothetical protein
VTLAHSVVVKALSRGSIRNQVARAASGFGEPMCELGQQLFDHIKVGAGLGDRVSAQLILISTPSAQITNPVSESRA